MKLILTDIEGTTTSIDFVHQELFPYSHLKLSSFVRTHHEENFIKDILTETSQTIWHEENIHADLEMCITKLLKWIDEDRKHSALKNLQGHIWETGYKNGDIKGHLYPEVKENLLKWKSAGFKLGVYSSGSVKAQELLFAHSVMGDIKSLFSFFFDTKVGHKRETQSYQTIAKMTQLNPQEILFLSDIKEELDAAKSAKFKTIQLVRKSDVIIGEHPTVKSFNDILI
jgi:enolase-phosphatase E1